MVQTLLLSLDNPSKGLSFFILRSGMDKHEVYIEQQEGGGMDRHDAYIDLDSYTTLFETNEEIKKLQLDIDIRRRARQRLGISEDDETILIIDEKIKLLEVKKKKLLSERTERRGYVWSMLFIFTLPAYIVQPITLIIPITIIGFFLVRKMFRRKKSQSNGN